MGSNKKYKLFSSPVDGSKAPCAFFASPAGCRNGDSCKFAHVLPDQSAKPDGVSNEAGSVVSSESEPENKGGKSIKVAKETENPFLEPGEKNPNHDSKHKKNRRGKRTEDHLPFANPKKRAKTESVPSATKTTTTNKKQKNSPNSKKMNKAAQSLPDFRSLNLPIASFSVPTPSNADKSSKKGEKQVVESSGASSDDSLDKQVNISKKSFVDADLPLPKSTAVGRKWLKAVQLTHSHKRYGTNYDFDRHRTLDEQAGICGPNGWIKAKPYGDLCAKAPQAIAIDCEMCETQDPVSGEKNHRALCRISVIDAETKEVLLDTLVKPAWPVTNYRTWINGIKEDDLDKVQFTVRHAQAFMMALCSQETVILGHAVYNDLAALHMEHHCVVDSALLFKVVGSETASVSLRDLALKVLKKEMPDTHCSVNDARTALLCLEQYLEKDGKVEPIERTQSKKGDQNAKTFSYYASQLFVHRIPKNVDESHLTKMFLTYTGVNPSEVEPIQFSESQGKTHVNFQSPGHATLAFETLDGKAEPDPSGRLQKKVFLRNGSYIRIRKMAYEKDSSDKDNKTTP